MKYLSLLLLLPLAGCPMYPTVPSLPTPGMQTSPVSGVDLHRVKERVDADPTLLLPCKNLEDVKDGASLADLLVVHKDDVLTFGDCKTRNSALVSVLREALNLK